MNQLDLIIAALTEYTEVESTDQYGIDYMACCGADIEFDHLDDCNAVKALAAARELKENLNLEQFAAFVRSTKAPITTADCKKFLVAEITKRPEIVLSIYRDFDTPENILPAALQEKKWLRKEMFNPTGTYYRVQDEYPEWFPWNQQFINTKMISASNLAKIRVFFLDPNTFDDSIGIAVYEDKQGNLILGEYVGD
jgi:hypothetical protein